MVKPKPLDLKEENPYPEDIFPEITDKEWKKINELLKKELGFPLDRVAGNINRKMWNNMRDWFLERIKSAVQGLLIDMEVTDLDEIVCSDGSHRRMDEKTRKRIITDLIKKWFPDMVSENE